MFDLTFAISPSLNNLGDRTKEKNAEILVLGNSADGI
jgi:hypothetical protein